VRTMSIPLKNLVSLLILFIGGYVVAVLISWVVLALYYSIRGLGVGAAVPINTPAELYLTALIPLMSPFFLVPLAAIAGFSLLVIQTRRNKWPIIALCGFIAVFSQLMLLDIFGEPIVNMMWFSMLLLIWLSIGAVLALGANHLWMRERKAESS
jgi:hypothetical protein